MKFCRSSLFVSIAALALLFGAGCDNRPEGVYKLDKEAAKKAAAANTAGQSEADRELGKALAGTLDQIDGTLELKAGGQFERRTTSPTFLEKGDKRESVETGSWKLEGDTILLESSVGKTSCKRSGGRLECKSEKDGNVSMYDKS
ncbi:MAG: hypothetical protein U0271_22750 [Polyangiaceae bacterium]